jgi:predicted nuclease of predicted toxin-antitoxin system
VGTLASELVAIAGLPTEPRLYVDANVPAGLVSFMRSRLGWDVLFVVEHHDLRRATDRRHYDLARQLARTLLTLDRDYLDDRRFPPTEGAGVIVAWAPNENLLAKTLEQVDRRVFRTGGSPLPLRGRKLVADPGWVAVT